MTTRQPLPFVSGHCNPGNPPDIHADCAGAYQGHTCTCPHHNQPAERGYVLRARAVVALIREAA